ncbi:MAG: type IX secretion system sortase PorU [Saprospiraceae bacterium]|nr:type IX secretion system sortase PorU [Saprospiraceae bacterium]
MQYLTYWTSLILLISIQAIQAQTSYSLKIEWDEKAKKLPTGAEGYYLNFDGAVYDEQEPMLPLWNYQIHLNEYALLDVSLENEIYQTIESTINFGNKVEAASPRITTSTFLDKKRPVGNILLLPLRKNEATGQLERLVEADVIVKLRQADHPSQSMQSRNNTTVSELSDGKIYKFYISETGIHKLDYTFLQTLGVDVDNIDPRNIQLLGNGGRTLPEYTSTARVDDLNENAIEIVGEGDGSFDANDYILFYGEGTKNWEFIEANERYRHRDNHYTDKSHYFIKIANSTGKRITSQASVTTTAYTTNSYDICAHYESNEFNLMEQEFGLPASGRNWYGDPFQLTRDQTFSLSLPNRISTEATKFYINAAGRDLTTSSTFTVTANGASLGSKTVTTVPSNIYGELARSAIFDEELVVGGTDINVQIQFSNPNTSAKAWLDYISVNARANLAYTGTQMAFSDYKTLDHSSATFQISNANSATIWDVTDAYNVRLQEKNSDGGSFGANINTLKRYIAFDGSGFLSATAVGAIANQNLHGVVAAPEVVIVYHPNFESAAEQLAVHRANHNNWDVLTVNIFDIYNEFSSGNRDATAVRDFAKMLYDRSSGSDSLRSLVLLGDGSFDYKSLGRDIGSNPNFIPVYETSESLDPLLSFTSDDYFALLDEGEGNINADQGLDIGVGRLPVRTATEAAGVVNKIIQYETNTSSMKDWRNRLVFIADDEDSNRHIDDAETVAGDVEQWASDYIQEKIYFDAYPQVTTSGGSRYPDVNEDILDNFFKGALVMSYLGHGTDDGWAQERVFTNSEINALENTDRLPLLITATCSFAPYDDPNLNSAGERLITSAQGGAIALMTTVRVVYANANLTLTKNTFEQLFNPINPSTGEMPTLGEVLRRAKNSSGILSKSNSRKYSLLGDPSMRLAYPTYKVVTTSINGDIAANMDTISALQRVTIRGEVRDLSGNLIPNFNGTLYPTVYDKKDQITTRVNDPSSEELTFALRRKVIFKGNVSVEAGQFEFSFVVPKDINYEFGNGQISYYGENQVSDANGVYNGLIVGGTDPNAPEDNTGPEVLVYMNDEKFAFGGLTDANPLLLVKLYDENGINTVGNGIGHDLAGNLVLPTNDNQDYILNDFYTAEKDDYTRGTVGYPLKSLPDGRHTIRVKAWDVYNNLGEGETEFIVASSSDLALQHVLNYPNPFTTQTNFQFEHNLPGQTLDVQVRIFSVSGNIIKTINETIQTDGYRVTDIAWDGLDEFGDRIARGVYIYKITVRADGLTGETAQESEYQKLVILR